ncbi:MAG: hypothetical protein IH991_14885, partial [Planctomycetes bacterium]|nr:hypothetical protein [Planctomycetota bacterium]
DQPSDDKAESTSEDGENADEKAKHRKIPTWNEAISVVVERNVQAHSKDDSGKRGRGRGKR